jgi:hypothetical protein
LVSDSSSNLSNSKQRVASRSDKTISKTSLAACSEAVPQVHSAQLQPLQPRTQVALRLAVHRKLLKRAPLADLVRLTMRADSALAQITTITIKRSPGVCLVLQQRAQARLSVVLALLHRLPTQTSLRSPLAVLPRASVPLLRQDSKQLLPLQVVYSELRSLLAVRLPLLASRSVQTIINSNKVEVCSVPNRTHSPVRPLAEVVCLAKTSPPREEAYSDLRHNLQASKPVLHHQASASVVPTTMQTRPVVRLVVACSEAPSQPPAVSLAVEVLEVFRSRLRAVVCSGAVRTPDNKPEAVCSADRTTQQPVPQVVCLEVAACPASITTQAVPLAVCLVAEIPRWVRVDLGARTVLCLAHRHNRRHDLICKQV